MKRAVVIVGFLVTIAAAMGFVHWLVACAFAWLAVVALGVKHETT
jgi:hypothetical protein